MRKSYFISDVHFGLQEKEKESAKLNAMLSLLERIQEDGERLFLVGDILDFWMEYRHVVPKGHVRFFAALENLVLSGVKVTYLAGNHDFYLGRYFQESFGIETQYGQIEAQLHGKLFLMAHGDGIGRGDLGYKFFRSVVRNNFNLRLFRWIHPDWGVGLMSYLSRLSRRHTYSPTDYGEKERLIIYANELTEKTSFSYFVCGHRHVPKIHRLKNQQSFYVNLGTWIDETPTYGVFDGTAMAIRSAETHAVVFSENAKHGKAVSANPKA
ncbi:metallophosphoesterase [Chloroherpeton thalassium ATCC 35110]|uniref:Metallophosphoesterase n=2 Tax=Chloroherpeton thalassium TaxID=100716 RepID=B3QV98_CHLT3|nr:metallophosphoesterase [Chloroherpeton thalassium ATCC 35110]